MAASDGGDFTSYVVARWGSLVRTLVLLGLTPEQADAVAVDGLARCAPGWAAAAREGDVDAWVWREVLARRGQPPADIDPLDGIVDPTVVDLGEREVVLARVVAELAALPEPDRLALALFLGGTVDTALAAELAGTPPRVDSGPSPERVARALAAVPLRPEPADAVLARAAARRGRRTRWTVGVATVLLAVLAAATWVGTRAPDGPPVDAEVTSAPAENAAPVIWWANSTLHLREVELEVPRVRALVEVPDGAVYADSLDRVVHVGTDGRQEQVGETVDDGPLVGGPERGWVGWVDVSGGDPELVVHDAVAGADVDRRSAPAGARVVGLDQERLYYVVDGQPWSWEVPGGDPVEEPGTGLAGVAAGVRVLEPEAGRVVVTDGESELTVSGTEPMLSPDGDYVMVRRSSTVRDEALVYRTDDGRLEEPHLNPYELAVAAAFGDDHSITYLVTLRDHAPDNDAFVRLSETGLLQMRTCDLDLATCRSATTVSNSRGVPVLAR